MPQSMTGYAEARITGPCGHFTLVLRSLNQRFLEINFRLPDGFQAFEAKARTVIKKHLIRGKVDVVLSMTGKDQNAQLQLNEPLAKNLCEAIEQLQSFPIDFAPTTAGELLRYPNLLENTLHYNDQDQEALHQGLTTALEQLQQSRAREGEALAACLNNYITETTALVQQLKTTCPQSLEALKQRLQARFSEAEINLDPYRLEQEMIFFAQKMDVSEEIDRLAAHLNSMSQLLSQSGAMGKRLDFLVQELHREANTLGAKIQALELKETILSVKVLIEKMKEQVQNIE